VSSNGVLGVPTATLEYRLTACDIQIPASGITKSNDFLGRTRFGEAQPDQVPSIITVDRSDIGSAATISLESAGEHRIKL
jgi:hypothetical protein